MTPDDSLDPVRQAALDAIALVIAKHLADERTSATFRSNASLPLLLHVDGPGKSLFLEALKRHLVDAKVEGGWAPVRFDAWRYQRLGVPWWWLITEMDRQLLAHIRSRGVPDALRRAFDGAVFRLKEARTGLLCLLVGVAILLVASPNLDDVKWSMDVLKDFGGVVGALTVTIGFFATVWMAARRWLVWRSPGRAEVALRSPDPMAFVCRRYQFLLGSARSCIVVMIDNLDRCQADYVVRFLEGLQTVMAVPVEGRKPRPLVAFVVAADEGWLCESFVQEYERFSDSLHVPGRLVGQSFLDKIFDVSLRLPTVPSAAERSTIHDDNRFASAVDEAGVRAALFELEPAAAAGRSPEPDFGLRIEAITRIGEIEIGSGLRLCNDTATQLRALRLAADLGPIVDKRLKTAYCVQRTLQLLGGHEVDHDGHAIRRLGLWTMLTLRWPRLAAHLVGHPEDLDQLRLGVPPDRLEDEDLRQVFAERAAVRLAGGIAGVQLGADDIRRFTTPVPVAPGPPIECVGDGATLVTRERQAAAVDSSVR